VVAEVAVTADTMEGSRQLKVDEMYCGLVLGANECARFVCAAACSCGVPRSQKEREGGANPSSSELERCTGFRSRSSTGSGFHSCSSCCARINLQ